MLFFIDYDLRKQRDYQPLYRELAKFNAVRVLESTWCFQRINTNCNNLVAHFSQFVDADDGLCITQVVDRAVRRPLAQPLQVA